MKENIWTKHIEKQRETQVVYEVVSFNNEAYEIKRYTKSGYKKYATTNVAQLDDILSELDGKEVKRK
ncbi:hypothetical protein AB4Z45_27840 [Paenibacillus sp. MCAF9]